MGLAREPSLIGILADAAAGVAAHEPLAAVGIEDAHRQVGLMPIAPTHQHQPVAADAHVGLAPRDGHCYRVGDGMLRGVNKDIVVAHTVHLDEVYLAHSMINPSKS